MYDDGANDAKKRLNGRHDIKGISEAKAMSIDPFRAMPARPGKPFPVIRSIDQDVGFSAKIIRANIPQRNTLKKRYLTKAGNLVLANNKEPKSQ